MAAAVAGAVAALAQATVPGKNGSAGLDGIAIDADQVGPVLDTLIEGNVVIGASDDGIDVDSSATTLIRNLAIHNGDLGIEAVAGVVDGGRNHAAANGNPAQCTNVAC